MDFVRIVQSLEDLLYEVMTWIIFYPRTILRILFRPTQMTLYSDSEQSDAPEEQFTDSLSPPLLLMLTIVITHGIELAAGLNATRDLRAGSTLAKVLGDEQNLLIVRALLTALVPLVIALVALSAQKTPLDRKALKSPFYSQCFLISPFALAISLATVVGRLPGTVPLVGRGVAIALALGALLWLCVAETRWFRLQHDVGIGRALLLGCGSVFLALSTALVVAATVALVF